MAIVHRSRGTTPATERLAHRVEVARAGGGTVEVGRHVRVGSAYRQSTTADKFRGAIGTLHVYDHALGVNEIREFC